MENFSQILNVKPQQKFYSKTHFSFLNNGSNNLYSQGWRIISVNLSGGENTVKIKVKYVKEDVKYYRCFFAMTIVYSSYNILL